MSNQYPLTWVQKMVLNLISWYQRFWSPDHSARKARYPYGYCRFSPTCSQYGYTAIEKHGVFKGSALTLWRIMRCNPFSPGGHDPVR